MTYKFLDELQEKHEYIAKNQIGRLEPDLSPDEVVTGCRKILSDLHKNHLDIDNILKDHLYPLLEDMTGISDELEAEIFATVQKISSYETRLDPGLALLIYQKLLDLARTKKDEDKIIRYLYSCGISLFFIRSGDQNQLLEYFQEAAAYFSKYHSFTNPETRKYIHRCLGNKIMMQYRLSEAPCEEWENETLNFWNDLIFSGTDQDFPWLTYFLSVLSYRHTLEARKARQDPDSETKENLMKILQTSMSINKLYHKNREIFKVFGGTRYDFALWEAQFLNGMISFNQLWDNIEKKKREFAPDDYSPDALYVNIQLPIWLMVYATKMYRLNSIRDEVQTTISRQLVEYILAIPKTVNPSDVNMQLQIFDGNIGNFLNPNQLLDFSLEITIFRHIPTHAHSIMVGKIASCLIKFLIEKTPAYFIGIFDFKNENDVINGSFKLQQFAVTSGLCHDIGKSLYTKDPFKESKIFTQDELETAKKHPRTGYSLLERTDGISPCDDYNDIILGHHRFYDNKGGYPDDFNTSESKFKPIIDIITVSDSIDAATDDIGKTYIKSKSLDVICKEIREEAGSRYSPVIAELLNDKAVFTALENILTCERKNAYYTAYLHNWN